MAADSMTGVVKQIMDMITDELVITSAGTISREVFAYRDRPENLYLMGALGCTLGVGIGLALNTKRRVVVIAGDGDVLMGLGTLALVERLGLANLELHIIDNGVYASTGCQPTCSRWVDFGSLTSCTVWDAEPHKTAAPRITLSPLAIQERFRHAIKHD